MNTIKTMLAAAIAVCMSVPAHADEKRPNIIFIMADDFGNADLGYRGGQIQSPNIDKLAQEGVRLESFYGQQVCTPSRAALMTGRYPMRYGLQTLVIFPGHSYGLPTDERTLPQALKEAGYKTLMTGKWHLGHADRKFWPQNRGFDYFYGNVMGEVDYFTRERGGVIDWQRNGTFLKEEGYYTTLIGDEAVKLIDEQDGKTPFFLYFASLAPHAPYQAPDDYKDRYKSVKDKTAAQPMPAMITALDDQIGRIVAELDKKGLRDNTIIIFASDNGGATSGLFASGAKSKEEWRTRRRRHRAGSKGSSLERAVQRAARAAFTKAACACPAIVNWPARLKPACRGRPVAHGRRHADASRARRRKGQPRPSLRWQGHLEDPAEGAPSPNEDVLIDVEAFRGAIRKGDWKLVKIALLPGKTELFDLAKDPGETTNVAEQNPEVVRDLEARLIAYAKQQKPSEWIKAQPAFVGAQGKDGLRSRLRYRRQRPAA